MNAVIAVEGRIGTGGADPRRPAASGGDRASGDKERVVDFTLDELEKRLPAGRFLRVHRSALVNLDAVQEIHSWFGGRLQVHLKGSGRRIPVSRQRARALRQALSP